MMYLKPIYFIALYLLIATTASAQSSTTPLAIDNLWKSDAFLRAYTGSYGVDSNIEPLIREDEESLLKAVAASMKSNDRKGAINKLLGNSLTFQRASLQFSLANLYFEEADADNAIKYFSNAIKAFPNFRDAHRNLAMVYIKEDKVDEAEPHLIRAVELGSKEGLTFGLLAHIHSQKERHQPALAAYRLAQVTMPTERQWVLGEAFTLHELEQYKEAASIYNTLLEKSPDDEQLWINQANAFLEMDQPAKAIANMEVVNRMEKLTPTNQFFLGQLYLRKGFPETAFEHYNNAIASNKITFDQATTAMVGLVSRSHWQIAEQFSNMCQLFYKDSFKSNEPDIQESVVKFERSLALLELETGKNESGAKRVEKIIEKNPLDGDALILLSKFYQAQKDYDHAIDLLEQAALITDFRANALYQHGLILVNQFGEYKEALQLLEQSFQLDAQPSLASYITELRAFVK